MIVEAIKKLNNNAVVCVDSKGNHLIALGNGLGFPKIPYIITDYSKIRKTYYGVSPEYYGLLNEIPEEIIKLSSKIVDDAKMLINNELSPNIVFTLADHIMFAKKRYEQNMTVKMPSDYEIKMDYEKEFEIGKNALKLINKTLNIHLTKDEATSIALHFINGQNIQKNDSKTTEDYIEDIVQVVQKRISTPIDKESFTYSRFVTHVKYLLRRQQEAICSENGEMFESLVAKYPEAYSIVLDIKDYISQNLGWEASNEELLYLILHVNRLCAKEDCYR